MPGTDGDLIDGQLSKLFQLGIGKSLFQIAFLNFFDHIPADVEMMGHILDGHVPTKLQAITFKGPGIAVARIGKVNTNLANQIAG